MTIDTLVGATVASLAAQVEAYLWRVCEFMGLTPEQLAEKYELEYSPLQLDTDDPSAVRATQTVRLVRRGSADTEGEPSG